MEERLSARVNDDGKGYLVYETSLNIWLQDRDVHVSSTHGARALIPRHDRYAYSPLSADWDPRKYNRHIIHLVRQGLVTPEDGHSGTIPEKDRHIAKRAQITWDFLRRGETWR